MRRTLLFVDLDSRVDRPVGMVVVDRYRDLFRFVANLESRLIGGNGIGARFAFAGERF